jgi:GMP synthase-like glutamine amidotransferase
MKIGIINCDQVEPELAAQFGQYPDMFISCLKAHHPHLSFCVFDALSQSLPSSLDECDGYLITGSRHGAYEPLEWITHLKKWIIVAAQSQTPLVGICFGHQVICQALGGDVRMSAKGWGLGVSSNQVVAPAPWFTPSLSSNTLKLLVSHQDQVQACPHGTHLLVSSDFCPNFMLSIGSHIFTIQGHPEFIPAYSKALIEKKRSQLKDCDYQKALTSLNENNDSKTVLQWIGQFFNMASAAPINRQPTII